MGVKLEEKEGEGVQIEECKEKLVVPTDPVHSPEPINSPTNITPSPYNTTTTVIRPIRFDISRMTEQKCVLSQSCCGCSLRSGSLAIGIVGLIFGIIGAIYGIYLGVNGATQGWIDFVVNLITIVLCGVLIQGVRQEKRGLVMVWVWVTAILIAINIVLGVIGIILTLNIIGAVILFIVMAIAVYCVLVVRSYAISLTGSSGGIA